MIATQLKNSAVALLLSLFCVCPPVLADGIFPDAGLEKAVRKQVFSKRNNDEPLTAEDVKNISVVRGADLKIKSLEGLEHCVALQKVVLSDNEISDLKPLSGLKLLISVELDGNQIESVEPLQELDQIQLLALSNNKIEDISHLAKMTNMRTLYLDGNRIKDISVLENFSKAWTLYLSKNPIEDFTPIGKMKWLSSFQAEDCGLKNVAFLKPLTELKQVYLQENQIKNLGPLVAMANADEQRRFSPFWEIYLKGNPLSEKAKKQLEELKKLGARIKMD